jgi:N-acetylmuramic acid 6-phosphate etherase
VRPGAWSRLPTEGNNPRSGRLDGFSTPRIVGLILDEDRRALGAVARERAAIARAAVAAARSLAAGGRLLFLGAGTSGRLGVQEAAECPPTFGTPQGRIRGVMAGGRRAVFRAVEGAEDRENEGRREGKRLRPRDLLVAISASSMTPFVRGALRGARARGAHTVLLTCAPGRAPRGLAEIVIALRTGPEVLTGSTRLKAGSATKAVLNAITTAAMVRLGKVFGNLMVDLRPTSAKLKDRSRRIVQQAAGVSKRRAERLLAAAGGEVKTAILMSELSGSASEARARLRAAGGHLRQALARARPDHDP